MAEDYEQHREFSNNLKNDLRKARQKYETQLLSKDTKAVYRYVRRRKVTSKVSVPLVRNKNNTLAESELESANILADYFGSVFVTEQVGPLPLNIGHKVSHSLENIEFTKDEVAIFCLRY
jgi:hypothetical protein